MARALRRLAKRDCLVEKIYQNFLFSGKNLSKPKRLSILVEKICHA